MLGSFIGDMVYKNNLREKERKKRADDNYKIKISNITVEKTDEHPNNKRED
jgi:hypothetical protein